MILNANKYCNRWIIKESCSVQVDGKMRRGQMVGRQSLVTANARPSLSTRSSWRTPAARSSHVASRITAALTSCPKCRMVGLHQPCSAVEDTAAPPHITNQPITLWFSVGQEMIGHAAVSVDLGRRWRFYNFWMCHLTVTFNQLGSEKIQRHWPLTWFQCHHTLSTRQRYPCEWFCVYAPVCFMRARRLCEVCRLSLLQCVLYALARCSVPGLFCKPLLRFEMQWVYVIKPCGVYPNLIKSWLIYDNSLQLKECLMLLNIVQMFFMNFYQRS